MMGKLAELVSADALSAWLLAAFLVAYFIYKEWPEFKKRMTQGAIKDKEEEVSERSVGQRLDTIEKDVKEIKEKLDRDYERINKLENGAREAKTAQNSTSEELELIMEALMGALGGLQELGANGPTKEAKNKIQDYLNKRAHEKE